jgi:hypothetical protein
MTRREPLFGPNAFVFFLLVGFVVAVNYWLAPWVRTIGEPELKFVHLEKCSDTPPPPGTVYLCPSTARP